METVPALDDFGRILIIGGGVAGLAAAAELSRKGYKNVKIFEARSRLGGRVCTVYSKTLTSAFTKFGTSVQDEGFLKGSANPSKPTTSDVCKQPVIELGAQWIHGHVGNSVYEYCKNVARANQVNNILDENCPDFMEKFNVWHQLSEKDSCTIRAVAQCVQQSVEKCSQQSNDYIRGIAKPVATSLYAFLRHQFEKQFLQNEVDLRTKKLLQSGFEWAVNLQNEINGGEAHEVSANYLGCYLECDGRNLTELGPRGYAAFLDTLCREIPREWFSMCTEVINVDYSSKPLKVTFRYVSSLHNTAPAGGMQAVEHLPRFCRKSQEDDLVEYFDHVICCLPLGVLKEQSSLFRPPLPTLKQRAISVLGFGTCNKIYLKFAQEDVFWEAGDMFHVLWLEEPLQTECKLSKSLETQERPWYHYINRFNAVQNNPQLLVAWIAGQGARAMELLPDNEILDKCHLLLKMATKRAKIPRPLLLVRSSWHTDVFSRGSFTFISTSCDYENGANLSPNSNTLSGVQALKELAEPVFISADSDSLPSCLLFGGEATSDRFYSTVHGAFDSGRREANRLNSFLLNESLKRSHVQSGPELDFDVFNTCNGTIAQKGRSEGTCLSNSKQKLTKKFGNLATDFFDEAEVGSQHNDTTCESALLKPIEGGLHGPTRQRQRRCRVAIIGAGAAGLGAALRLHQASSEASPRSLSNFRASKSTRDDKGDDQDMNTVIILEAQEYPGGRICTFRGEPNGCLELGAQWVHGEDDNDLYEICRKHNLLTDPCADYSVEGKGLFLRPDGTSVPEELVERTIMVLDGVKEELTSMKAPFSKLPSKFKSAGDAYCHRFEMHLRSLGLEGDPTMAAIMEWYRKFEVVDNACNDIHQLSLRGYGDYVECPGVYYINFRDGYDSFVRTVIDQLPENCVQLKTAVSQIIWDREDYGNPAVILEIADGSSVICDHVIFTCSISVLKDFKFVPPLPTYKLKALSCFGCDAMDKIFLIWDNPFWGQDVLGFQFLWTFEDNAFFKEHGEYLRGIYGFEKVSNRRNVLLGWIGGSYAVAMEAISDKQLMSGCYHLLKRFAGKVAEVTPPSRVIRSAWGTNRFVRGAYSHRLIAFDSTERALEKLQHPLCSDFHGLKEYPLVLFAGEATDPIYFSTVHGALRSGYREADRLLQYWRSTR